MHQMIFGIGAVGSPLAFFVSTKTGPSGVLIVTRFRTARVGEDLVDSWATLRGGLCCTSEACWCEASRTTALAAQHARTGSLFGWCVDGLLRRGTNSTAALTENALAAATTFALREDLRTKVNTGTNTATHSLRIFLRAR